MKPYYEADGITIYHGDCREVLPALQPGAVVTDPPYPDYHAEAYAYNPDTLHLLAEYDCRQFVFWSAKEPFPLPYSAIHIWDKLTGAASQYERIFERNGGATYRVFRSYLINSTVAASYQHDTFTGHPSQKPIRLMRELVSLCPDDPIVDPFMGSGSTLRAAMDAGRKAVGIEVDERYCEIAVRRLAQGVLSFGEV